jgi:acetylornithine deacetylase
VAGEIVDSVEMLRRLVAFDTTSRNSNLALIDYLQEYLKGHGVASKLVPSEDGKKANLFATVGPNAKDGVVLSGHTDVVPVDGQPWDTDPWTLTLKDGKYHGRGTCDMKAFYAIALARLPEFRKAKLKRPIHFALSYDEEVGCVGAPHLLAWVARQSPRPAIALIGEPTSMRVVNAHTGILVAHTEITGVEAHSSLAHLGISAIALAARAVDLLPTIEAESAATTSDPRFEPTRATISVYRIGGGTAVNILAGRAWFEWVVRSIPGVDAGEVCRQFE